MKQCRNVGRSRLALGISAVSILALAVGVRAQDIVNVGPAVFEGDSIDLGVIYDNATLARGRTADAAGLEVIVYSTDLPAPPELVWLQPLMTAEGAVPDIGEYIADDCTLGGGFVPTPPGGPLGTELSSYEIRIFRSRFDPGKDGTLVVELWDGDPACKVINPPPPLLPYSCLPIAGSRVDFEIPPTSGVGYRAWLRAELPNDVFLPHQRVWVVMTWREGKKHPGMCRIGWILSDGPPTVGASDEGFQFARDANLDAGTCCDGGAPCDPSSGNCCPDDDLPAGGLNCGGRYFCKDGFAEEVRNTALTDHPMVVRIYACVGPCPPQIGACCNGNNGTCAYVLGSACPTSDPQFTWFRNTPCLPNPCVEHDGACCDGNTGTCTQVVQSVCPTSDPQFTWFKNTLCANVTCEEHTGACCDGNDGTCTQVVESACPTSDPQFTFFEKTDCADLGQPGFPPACVEHTFEKLFAVGCVKLDCTNKTKWSIGLNSPPHSPVAPFDFEKLDCGPLSSNPTTAALAAADLVTCITSLGVPGIINVVQPNPMLAHFIVTAKNKKDFELCVGSANLPPTDCCFTTGTGCTFNPEVIQIILSETDCNGNGEDDALDIFFGTSNDADGNGIPDECEEAIPTVSAWGLVVFTLLLLAAAKIYFGRRRRVRG